MIPKVGDLMRYKEDSGPSLWQRQSLWLSPDTFYEVSTIKYNGTRCYVTIKSINGDYIPPIFIEDFNQFNIIERHTLTEVEREMLGI